MRAAVYSRYSTDLQNDKSCEDQTKECVTRAERDGYEVVKNYEDAAPFRRFDARAPRHTSPDARG